MRHFVIYQLNNEKIKENPLKCFLGYDERVKRFGAIDINEYDIVYAGEIDGDKQIDILEKLFYIFNLEHPEDFRGHSLSVGDIVGLGDELWYCDSFGWKQI